MALTPGFYPTFSFGSRVLFVDVRGPSSHAFSPGILSATVDLLPIGKIAFCAPGVVLHGRHSTFSRPHVVGRHTSCDTVVSPRLFGRGVWPGTVVSARLLGRGTSPGTVVSARLLAQDAWPGTWLEWPVVAHERPRASSIHHHRRRRFVGSSWGLGDRIGCTFRETSGEGGGAGGGVRGLLNW